MKEIIIQFFKRISFLIGMLLFFFIMHLIATKPHNNQSAVFLLSHDIKVFLVFVLPYTILQIASRIIAGKFFYPSLGPVAAFLPTNYKTDKIDDYFTIFYFVILFFIFLFIRY